MEKLDLFIVIMIALIVTLLILITPIYLGIICWKSWRKKKHKGYLVAMEFLGLAFLVINLLFYEFMQAPLLNLS